MSHEREERKRAERARARQQVGSALLLSSGGAAWDEWDAELFGVGTCVCGAKVATVAEVLLCEHGKKREA